MAGLYPDVPGHRMAYDRDGTVGVHLVGNHTFSSFLSPAQMVNINDESGGNVTGGDLTVCLIFPELRDIVAMLHVYGQSSSGSSVSRGTLESSPDTTNGIDGTWNAFGLIGYSGLSAVLTRNGIEATALAGVKGVRMIPSGGGALWHTQVWHIYGSPAAGENPDRLRIWHPTLHEEVGPAYFDWGDVPQSSSADRTFRVRNNSATLTAVAPVVSMEALTDTTPSVRGQHLFSLDGTTFAASRTLPDLAPGEISGQVTLRRNLGATAALSLWMARIAVVAADWV